MPMYEFECKACRHRFEELLRSGDGAAPACPECGKRGVERLPSVFAAHGAAAPRTPLPRAGGCGRCGDPSGPCGLD